MKAKKVRHQLFLAGDLSDKLEALAAKPGASKSAILADAVAAWLDRRGNHELDQRFGLRLNRISAQLNRIERDGQVLLETLALFVRYQLTVTAPLPEPDAATRAVARDRFKNFVDQVARQIAGGGSGLRSATAPEETS
ncbi:MAG: CopG family transcriptional regulator [Azospirillum sp.]|nr:CopG family transcriptional regulator [Azospirillum sp.]